MPNATLDEPEVVPPDLIPPDDDGGGGDDGGDDDDGGDPPSSPPPPPPGDSLPFSTSRLATFFLLAMVLMLFAGFLSGFVILEKGEGGWPPPGFRESLPVAFWISTFLIASSSLAGFSASRQMSRREPRRAANWLLVTFLLGLGFCGSQIEAWSVLARSNRGWSAGNYYGNFFAITTLHAAHVVGGIIWLALASMRARRRAWSGKLAESTGNALLYWHTVGALWFVLFWMLLT